LDLKFIKETSEKLKTWLEPSTFLSQMSVRDRIQILSYAIYVMKMSLALSRIKKVRQGTEFFLLVLSLKSLVNNDFGHC
jgi:hypothetical protein